MFRLFRTVLNTILLNSPYFFDDGSRISYLVQLDILRYQTGGEIRKILDIGLEYDVATGLMRIETGDAWRWRSPEVPLNEPSEAGPELTDAERSDVIHKVRTFIGKHQRKYARF